jgi:hypothetical protein
VRIVFINKAEKPSSSESIFKDVFAELEASGATVDAFVPEQRLFDMANLDTSADIVVLRTRTIVGLNLAAALEVAGARLLIPFERERVLRNKFLLHQKLLDNGIPTPKSPTSSPRENNSDRCLTSAARSSSSRTRATADRVSASCERETT